MNKTKKPLSTGKKLLIALIVLALVFGAAYLNITSAFHILESVFKLDSKV